ncbi:MAG: type I-E CRISPR-associated protein Cas6/Cse3/CasE [Eubacteriales bacterium]|nr:type I-E CRISPR-associated protein Cas6/Cse3/CasE [Eubacteriales bacterium]
MFLSRVELDPKRRDTMRALASPSMLHGAIETGFMGERKRNLWRIDYLGEHCYLMVLSEDEPNFTELTAQFGVKEDWQTKSYDPLLERITQGQCWQFRLCANPVQSEPIKGEKRGKIRAHVTQEQQKQWLMERAERYGFLLKTDDFDVVDTRWYRFKKRGQHEITLRTATFEGTLQITNAEQFIQTLINGVGREKAYGCGLLTIAKQR